MTREEHISNLETIGCDGWTVTTEAYKSLQFAIKALEQKPCDDCISRVEARKHIYQRLYESALNNVGYECKAEDVFMDIADNRLSTWISEIPSIHPKSKTDVLDKIRTEIHATAEFHEDGNYYLRDEWIDEIFDKYKAEKEGK